MRRAVSLLLLTLAITACDQRGSADDRLADADAQERSRQEKVAKDMVAQTEDQVRVKMLEQRLAALEAQVPAMQGDRKLPDPQLVDPGLNQIEAGRVGADDPVPAATPTPAATRGQGRAPAAQNPSQPPPARKPLVLDLR